jgi:hypothetical protein
MTFHEDQSRLRVGHGAKNMAIVRHWYAKPTTSALSSDGENAPPGIRNTCSKASNRSAVNLDLP